ncbi:DUF1257 domain-containing protein [Synechococcus sp. CS-1325]|uniref:DUF1257 domain-containing protein n=1 Tax=unclassified Synechococcus TaxID=2626047 RepID=UPI000DB39A22|nr:MULTISPECIES: DUF1257 domain-containing protein [unclassified Synechococcus]MCT0198265.1 DUF1257 domain-containing protein [Synechococcus sp. CS-1325]MCT0213658.1 DUF1257 domain-containing protein [Synechococcus sp. CS-1326]MCT0234125.1 DUF1257 domain-containing protein [Synechococcus sp. CS-1327]PZU96988.1 MAG: hypothetical protein DCF24_13050 [Cyanobium sp.]
MSHFTTIRTRLMEASYLHMALVDLGHTVQHGPVTVNGYQGNTTTADLKIITSNSSYDIGFQNTTAGFELVADWWGIRGIEQTSFLRQLHQRYAYHAAQEALIAEGFSLVEEEQQQDGTLHLVLRRSV